MNIYFNKETKQNKTKQNKTKQKTNRKMEALDTLKGKKIDAPA